MEHSKSRRDLYATFHTSFIPSPSGENAFGIFNSEVPIHIGKVLDIASQEPSLLLAENLTKVVPSFVNE